MTRGEGRVKECLLLFRYDWENCGGWGWRKGNTVKRGEWMEKDAKGR